jgi:hypothetical protein
MKDPLLQEEQESGATQMRNQTVDSDVPEIDILPSGSLFDLRLGDLWHYRGLFFFLTWRDVYCIIDFLS